MAFQLTENERPDSRWLLERLTHSSWIYTRRHTERNAACFRVSGMFYRQCENGDREATDSSLLGHEPADEEQWHSPQQYRCCSSASKHPLHPLLTALYPGANPEQDF